MGVVVVALVIVAAVTAVVAMVVALLVTFVGLVVIERRNGRVTVASAAGAVVRGDDRPASSNSNYRYIIIIKRLYIRVI